MDIKRNLLAGVLVALVVLCMPYYLELVGYTQETDVPKVASEQENAETNDDFDDIKNDRETIHSQHKIIDTESLSFSVKTNLYIATLSSKSGGSLLGFEIVEENAKGLKYYGGFDDGGNYNDSIPVSLILEDSNYCNPCLSQKDGGKLKFYNTDFYNTSNVALEDGSVLSVDSDEVLELSFEAVFDGFTLKKIMKFSNDSYQIGYSYIIKNNLINEGDFELVWDGGLKPTEFLESEDVTYATASLGQIDEIVDASLGNDDKIESEKFIGQTDWAGIRTKYFITSLISEQPGNYGVLGGHNIQFGDREHTPKHTISIGYGSAVSNISGSMYIGPLDIDHISKTNSTLENTMNFGFSLIRPISKGVLWFLKFLHNTFSLNYGIVLILFAVLIRIVTGPLTKKSFQSSQKMQKVQPKIKKLQAKYKDNPQKLNKEMMAFYKKEGVNPLGGCLPMLIQMPLLWALFVVFRSTIEFRGASFIFWIKDLSQPDAIFTLPFSIPIYGAHVAILPIIMGISMFMTQKLSMATMDKSQRPMMYFMSAFFFLLFNSFPSGLNLYYTVYNILSYFQQRSIRQSINSN